MAFFSVKNKIKYRQGLLVKVQSSIRGWLNRKEFRPRWMKYSIHFLFLSIHKITLHGAAFRLISIVTCIRVWSFWIVSIVGLNRIKIAMKIHDMGSRLSEMRKLAEQLKKDRDSAIKKVNIIENNLSDSLNKIQVCYNSRLLPDPRGKNPPTSASIINSAQCRHTYIHLYDHQYAHLIAHLNAHLYVHIYVHMWPPVCPPVCPFPPVCTCFLQLLMETVKPDYEVQYTSTSL